MSLPSNWIVPKMDLKSRGEEKGQDEKNKREPKSSKHKDGVYKGDQTSGWKVLSQGPLRKQYQ